MNKHPSGSELLFFVEHRGETELWRRKDFGEKLRVLLRSMSDQGYGIVLIVRIIPDFSLPVFHHSRE